MPPGSVLSDLNFITDNIINWIHSVKLSRNIRNIFSWFNWRFGARANLVNSRRFYMIFSINYNDLTPLSFTQLSGVCRCTHLCYSGFYYSSSLLCTVLLLLSTANANNNRHFTSEKFSLRAYKLQTRSQTFTNCHIDMWSCIERAVD